MTDAQKARVRWRVGGEPVQRCGMVSKHFQTATGTSGNVWKQRFGWVRGKSVSRVHGRPEKPEIGGASCGNRGKGVEKCQKGGKKEEASGENDRDGNSENR